MLNKLYIIEPSKSKFSRRFCVFQFITRVQYCHCDDSPERQKAQLRLWLDADTNAIEQQCADVCTDCRSAHAHAGVCCLLPLLACLHEEGHVRKTVTHQKYCAVWILSLLR